MTTDRTTEIVVLVDDRAEGGLIAEHGLAIWVRSGRPRILFDTGAGAALEGNAARLGVDLRELDAVVLSHGHYDHTGGLETVLRLSARAVLYSHPRITATRYSIRDGTAYPVGAPPDATAAITGLPVGRLYAVDRPVMLGEGIGLTGPIPRESDFEDTGGPFFVDPEGRAADTIEDDMALWIRTPGGTIVCAGCSHAGLINALRYVGSLTGGASIRAVVGGFHLLNASEERLRRTAESLRRIGPELIAPCHCTGERAVAVLRDQLGERIVPVSAGTRLRL